MMGPFFRNVNHYQPGVFTRKGDDRQERKTRGNYLKVTERLDHNLCLGLRALFALMFRTREHLTVFGAEAALFAAMLLNRRRQVN